MIIIKDGRRFQEYEYSDEDDLEKEVVTNSKLFFGKDTVYIDTKEKIESKALGGAIPDGLLLDLSDKDSPEFYLVEVELASHDFYKHIFRQITKFFAFFKNSANQTELVEKIFSIVNTHPNLKAEFKKSIGEKEVYKFVKDTVDNSQNILLIMDGAKEELPEVMETYTDTWGKMVKSIVLKKFVGGNETIYTVDPEFETIEYAYVEPSGEAEKAEYSEEYHLEDIDKGVKEAYLAVKQELLKADSKLVFNPQKYYISIIHKKNVAYFRFRKKKIRLVVMLPEEEVKRRIRKHDVRHLSEGVQRFWSGPSCEIQIEGTQNIEEIVDLLKPLVMGNAGVV